MVKVPVPTFIRAMTGVPVPWGLSWMAPAKVVLVLRAPIWKVLVPDPLKPPSVVAVLVPDRLPNCTVGVAVAAVSINPNEPLMFQEAAALPVLAALPVPPLSDHMIPRAVEGSEKLPVKPLLLPYSLIVCACGVVLARARVPAPEMLPDKLTLAVRISADSVPPDAITMGVLNVAVVALATPLDSCNVPEFIVVVPVKVEMLVRMMVDVPARVRPDDPANTLPIDALALAVILPEVLVMVPPDRVKVRLAAGLNVRDWAVCVPDTVTVPAAPVPGLPPKMAAAEGLHATSVRPLLKVQVLLVPVVFQVPLPLSMRLLAAVASHTKPDADPFKAQNIFCSFCVLAERQQNKGGNIYNSLRIFIFRSYIIQVLIIVIPYCPVITGAIVKIAEDVCRIGGRRQRCDPSTAVDDFGTGRQRQGP